MAATPARPDRGRRPWLNRSFYLLTYLEHTQVDEAVNDRLGRLRRNSTNDRPAVFCDHNELIDHLLQSLWSIYWLTADDDRCVMTSRHVTYLSAVRRLMLEAWFQRREAGTRSKTAGSLHLQHKFTYSQSRAIWWSRPKSITHVSP